MRTRIGIVQRDERLHPRLTVQQALGYAAELRLPPDTSPEHRDRVVDQVLEELELTPHRATRISKLSPELRRCVSMAVELITRPTLLVVDEPDAGLDPAQQGHVMAILRRQADIGCAVVVAMSSQTSPSNLNMCDQVLVLTSRGTMAFVGTPLQVESSMGTTDWAESPRAGRRRSRRCAPRVPGPATSIGSAHAARGRRAVAAPRRARHEAANPAGRPSPAPPALRRPHLPLVLGGPALHCWRR